MCDRSSTIPVTVASVYTCAVPLLLPLLLAAASPVAAAPPPADTSLAPDAEARWIAFDLTPGNQIRFTATVDGRPVTAILDTGVSYSVIARRYAEANRLAIREGGRADVIGGSVAVGTIPVATLAMGGMVRRGGTLAVADLPAAATGSAIAVDLLVGRDLTASYALDIDYAQRRFRFLRSGRLPFRGTTSPLAIAPDRLVYVSQVILGGARLQPMVVDTGDGSAITLSAAAWATAEMPRRATTTTISFGLLGPVVSEVAVVPTIVVGRTIARMVEVRVEPAGGFSEAIGVAGRIGSGFLQNYRVLLDSAAGHMVLAPEAGADKPPVRSTSGLLLGVLPDRLKVLHVMRGGPAAAAGWRDGDTICRIDGTPVTRGYPTSALAAWGTRTAGSTVMLGMCDGTQRALTLRAFY